MNILRRNSINLSDVAAFGPAFWRHLPRITGAETVLINVAVRKFTFLAGDSDIDAVRQPFAARRTFGDMLTDVGAPQKGLKINFIQKLAHHALSRGLLL